MFDSLGIVLTRGYGQYIFIGNVSVEEGKSLYLYLYRFSEFVSVCLIALSYFFSAGLHDLLAPDLAIASEWLVLYSYDSYDTLQYWFPLLLVLVALLKKCDESAFLFVCAGRTYCETDIDPAHRKLSQLQAVVRYLTGKEPDLECKRTLSSLYLLL